MYLHAGGNVLVRKKDIIGIFDIDNMNTEETMKNFLRKAEKKGETCIAGDGLPKSFILVPGYGAQGGKGKDLVHFFNEDGLGAIVNSSRGIIAAYKQDAYAQYGAENYADASRAAVIDMQKDIVDALAK